MKTVNISGSVWQILLGLPRFKFHDTHVIMLKTFLHLVQYSMNTTYNSDFNASYYISQMNYLRFLVFIFVKKLSIFS